MKYKRPNQIRWDAVKAQSSKGWREKRQPIPGQPYTELTEHEILERTNEKQKVRKLREYIEALKSQLKTQDELTKIIYKELENRFSKVLRNAEETISTLGMKQKNLQAKVTALENEIIELTTYRENREPKFGLNNFSRV